MTNVTKEVLAMQEAVITMCIEDEDDKRKQKLKEVAEKLQESKNELEQNAKATESEGRISQKRRVEQPDKELDTGESNNKVEQMQKWVLANHKKRVNSMRMRKK